MPKVILYKDANYKGEYREVGSDVKDFREIGFNDVLTSLIVESGTWTLFSNSNYGSPSVTISPHGGPNNDGKYPASEWLGGRNDYYSSIKLNSSE